MSLRTRDQLTDHIAKRVDDTQIETFIEDSLELTLEEIWSYAPWNFKRRKQTFATVASQEAYNLDEEVDEVRLLRQLTTPNRLLYLPDEVFYRYIADPENQATGNPTHYRLWEETGFQTNLAAADTIYVASSSALDTSTFNLRVVGRNSSGEVIAETLTLNGTTNVTSATTFAADGLMQISKSARTTGTITCSRTTGATQLTELAPDQLAPRFKRLSLYPIPSAAITMYLEYDERYRPLVHDTDIPQMDHKWLWVAMEGTLAKVWQYKQNAAYAELSHRKYQEGLTRMAKQDGRNLDYVPVLERRQGSVKTVYQTNDALGRALQF